MAIPKLNILQVPHFTDGLNTVQYPTQIKDTEVQQLDNMLVNPKNLSSEFGGDAISYFAMTARNGYRTLHTDLLPFYPRNLVEYAQPTSGTTFFSQVNDWGGDSQDVTYIYTSTANAPVLFTGTFHGSYPVPDPLPPLRVVKYVELYCRFRARGGSGVIKGAVRVNGTVYYQTSAFSGSTTGNTSGVFNVVRFRFTTNPNTGLAWTPADLNKTGASNLTHFGFALASGAGIDVSSMYFKFTYEHTGPADAIATGFPNSDFLTTNWTVLSYPLGIQYLLTGGFDPAAGTFKVHYLMNGTSTTVQLSSQSAGGKYAAYDTGQVSFFKYNQYIYYTDGNFKWRRWDGLTDAASGFTTVTKVGAIHKDRAFYGNDVTNTLGNYLYYSSTGDPETVSALNFFRVGEATDPIVNLIDKQDHLLIIKERSTWALYLSVDVTNSLLLRKNESKGSPAPLGSILTDQGIVEYTLDSGTQINLNNANFGFNPICVNVFNLLRGTRFETNLALGYSQDQLLIASSATNPIDTTTPRVFIYDFLTEKNFKYTLTLSCFLQDKVSTTYDKHFKACTQAGYIIELDHNYDGDETTFTCHMRTKEFMFNALSNRKTLNWLVLDVVFPDNPDDATGIPLPLTVKTYIDGENTATIGETFTIQPDESGYKRIFIPVTMSKNTGHKISVDLSHDQKAKATGRFSVFSMMLGYHIEPRMDKSTWQTT